MTAITCLFLSILSLYHVDAFVGVKMPCVSLLKLQARKLSFAEKKKRRAQKLVKQTVKLDAPSSVTITRPDARRQKVENKEPAQEEPSPERKKAAELISAQKTSVAMLKLVMEQVQSLPFDTDVANDINERGFYVKDDFIKDEASISEMQREAISIHVEKGKLQLIARTDLGVASGEYSNALKGGEDYADSPRCTEFVVSLTRHMPPLINDALELSDYKLDESASMGSLTLFDRKSQLSALAMLTGTDTDEPIDISGSGRSFGYVTGGDEKDARKISCIYFFTPTDWDSSCGGGLAFEKGGNEIVVEAKMDRLVLFKSDTLLYKNLPWKGRDGLENGAYIVTHFVKKRE